MQTAPAPKQLLASKRAIMKLLGKGFRPRCYSGRGMYGQQCVGVTVGRYDVDTAKRCFRGAVMDNMGMDYIVYWPHLVLPSDDSFHRLGDVTQAHLDRANDWISVNGGRKGPLEVAMELAELDEANND